VAGRIHAATVGLALTYVPYDAAKEAIECGERVKVLEEWCAPFPWLLPLLSQQTAHHGVFAVC
jgi:DNA-binding transcriptional LysR family regulator